MIYSKKYFNQKTYSFLFFSKKITFLLFTLSVVFIQVGKSQDSTSQDSLAGKSYKYLYGKMSDFYRIPTKSNIYAKAYLDKGLRDDDSTNIIKGYYFLSDINIKNYPISLAYINNAIVYNRDDTSNFYTPYIYNLKGGLFQKKGEYLSLIHI